MHDRTIVSIRDLRFAALHCRHCNTRVTLDLDAEFEPGTGRTQFAVPRECPRCNNPFDSAVPVAVDRLQKAYKALAGLDAVSFESDRAPAAPKP